MREKNGSFWASTPIYGDGNSEASEERTKGEKHITPMSTGDGWVAELVPQLENLRDAKPLEFKAFLPR